LARRVLNGPLGPSLLFVLALASCRRVQRAPAPSASASSAGSNFAAQARERHFREELARASTRFRAKPTLGDCASVLQERADLELCQSAERALAVISDEPEANTVETSLKRLAPTALALARLSERLRYLSLAELAERHVEGDAGAAPSPSASGAIAGALAAATRAHDGQHALHAEQRAVVLNESPIAQRLLVSMRLEGDVIRNLGAYLEYGPLPVRRAAFNTVEQLRAEHPRWPALDHLLREAVVLESDPTLKGQLRQLSASGAPPGAPPAQSAGTK